MKRFGVGTVKLYVAAISLAWMSCVNAQPAIPHQFSPGQPASAAQMNENFARVSEKLEALQAMANPGATVNLDCAADPDALNAWFTSNQSTLVRNVTFNVFGRCNSHEFVREGLLQVNFLGASTDAALVGPDDGRPVIAGINSSTAMYLRDLRLEASNGPVARVTGTVGFENVVMAGGGVDIHSGANVGLNDVDLLNGDLLIRQASSVLMGGTTNFIRAGSVDVREGSVLVNWAPLTINEGQDLLGFNVMHGSTYLGQGGSLNGKFRWMVVGSNVYLSTVEVDIESVIQVSTGSSFWAQFGTNFIITKPTGDYCCNGWGLLINQATARIEQNLKFVGFTEQDQVLQLIEGSNFLLNSQEPTPIPLFWVFDSSSASLSGAVIDNLDVRGSSYVRLNSITLNSFAGIRSGSSVDMFSVTGQAGIQIDASFAFVANDETAPLAQSQFGCSGPARLNFQGATVDPQQTNCFDNLAWDSLFTSITR